MTRRTAAAGRLWDGSGLLARRGAVRCARWVAAGRRPDLTGWRGALGPLVRGLVLAVVAYAAVRITRAVPAVLWVLVPVWVIAAYRTRPAPPPAAAEKAAPEAPADPRAAFARWLLQTIGNRPGIHLRELYPAMRQLPGHEGRPDAVLRAALRTLGIPVVRTLRVGAVGGRSGVRRAAVEALLPRPETGSGEQHGDAGQSPDSPVLSTVGERVESA